MILSTVSLVKNDIPIYENTKKKTILNIINKLYNSDLILFPGYTFENISTFLKVIEKSTNNNSVIVFEIYSKDDYDGCGIVQEKKIKNIGISQIFATSKEANDENLSEILDKMATERYFKHNNKRIRLIICGENNLLRNQQSNHNKVFFRSKDKALTNRFTKMVDDTDIFLNPAHTPMGNLGKLKKRWAYLSENKKVVLFTTNEISENPNMCKKSLQYIFYNGQELEGKTLIGSDYKITTIYI